MIDVSFLILAIMVLAALISVPVFLYTRVTSNGRYEQHQQALRGKHLL